MLNRAFTVIELLVVISIISMLSSIMLVAFADAKERAIYSIALQEFREFEAAVELYKLNNNGQLPPDQNRDIPPGLEQYLSVNAWPAGPWPGSVWDWDNVPDYFDPVNGPADVQISIRFCPYLATDTSNCHFPREPWAKYFGVDSAIYYCISGNCSAHGGPDVPFNYPGYCVNCAVQPSEGVTKAIPY